MSLDRTNKTIKNLIVDLKLESLGNIALSINEKKRSGNKTKNLNSSPCHERVDFNYSMKFSYSNKLSKNIDTKVCSTIKTFHRRLC